MITRNNFSKISKIRRKQSLLPPCACRTLRRRRRARLPPLGIAAVCHVAAKARAAHHAAPPLLLLSSCHALSLAVGSAGGCERADVRHAPRRSRCPRCATPPPRFAAAGHLLGAVFARRGGWARARRARAAGLSAGSNAPPSPRRVQQHWQVAQTRAPPPAATARPAALRWPLTTRRPRRRARAARRSARAFVGQARVPPRAAAVAGAAGAAAAAAGRVRRRGCCGVRVAFLVCARQRRLRGWLDGHLVAHGLRAVVQQEPAVFGVCVPSRPVGSASVGRTTRAGAARESPTPASPRLPHPAAVSHAYILGQAWQLLSRR